MVETLIYRWFTGNSFPGIFLAISFFEYTCYNTQEVKMAKIVFTKLTIKETENVRAGIAIRNRFLGELCGTPDIPGASCGVPTPNPKSCRTKHDILHGRSIVR